MNTTFDRYVKAFLAGAIALATTLGTGWDDGHLTSSEKWLAVGAAITAAVAVAAFSNVWAKAASAALVAGVAAVATALEDDMFSAQEVVTVVVAVLGGLWLVYQTPNSPPAAHNPYKNA